MAIICATMFGNMSVAFKGSTKLSPRSTPERTFMIAASTRTLPAVFAVISRDWRIGTPDESKVESVRVKRAMAILRSTCPMIGSFSSSPSSVLRPPGVP
jgi:hypothetical protein